MRPKTRTRRSRDSSSLVAWIASYERLEHPERRYDASLYVYGAFTDLEAGTNVDEAVLSMLTPVELGKKAVQTDCFTQVAATASNP